MRALRFPAVRMAEVIEVERPRISGVREVLVQVAACGICASDVMAYKGTHPYRVPPVITGHECSGTVVEIAESVTEVKVGDRVAIEPHLGCGDCYYCRTGEYQQCTRKRLIGVGDWIGGFAEFVLADERMCYKVPDDVPFDVATLLEPYNVGVHAVRRAAIRRGESVGVVGCGTIGLMTVLAATRSECSRIYVTDVSDAKLQAARDIGADVALNVAGVDPVAEVMESEAPGLDVVFLAVPLEEAFDQALRLCRPQGRIVLIATRGSPAAIDTHKIQQFERTITGTAMYNRDDWNLSMEHIGGDQMWRFERLITNRIDLAEAAEVIDQLANDLRPEDIKNVISLAGGRGG